MLSETTRCANSTPPLTKPTFAEVRMANSAFKTRPPRGQSKKGLEGRFWERVIPEPNSGCWLWMGAASLGYGRLYHNRLNRPAHQISYEINVGPIPVGHELDHLCRNPACVNPEHLEPVTHRENVRRGVAGIVSGEQQRSKTHCPSGHEYTEDNTYTRQNGHRSCRSCERERNKLNQRVVRRTRSEDEKVRLREYQRLWKRAQRAKVIKV